MFVEGRGGDTDRGRIVRRDIINDRFVCVLQNKAAGRLCHVTSICGLLQHHNSFYMTPNRKGGGGGGSERAARCACSEKCALVTFAMHVPRVDFVDSGSARIKRSARFARLEFQQGTSFPSSAGELTTLIPGTGLTQVNNLSATIDVVSKQVRAASLMHSELGEGDV